MGPEECSARPQRLFLDATDGEALPRFRRRDRTLLGRGGRRQTRCAAVPRLLAARSNAAELVARVEHQTATHRLRSLRSSESKPSSTWKAPAPSPGNALKSHSSGPEQTDSKSINRYPALLTRTLPR